MSEPLLVAKARDEIFLLPALANRHGLIAGATGTGKTVTLQRLADAFSRVGVPVFMADVKGDLAGLSHKGEARGKVRERIEQLKGAARASPTQTRRGPCSALQCRVRCVLGSILGGGRRR